MSRMTDAHVKCRTTSLGVYHYYHSDFYYSMPNISKTQKMHGVKRVLVFCILIVLLPATLIIIPLYLRKTVFADVTYPVAESDIIEIRDGISSIFCQQHSLRMSSQFNAFQLSSKPEISTNRKHIRLKKSMTLPDDTLEYWGFYLLKGAKVHLKFCSRYDGSRILVVKGQRDLKTCGLLEHNKNKMGGANLAQGHDQVKVFFEDLEEFAGNHPIDEMEMKRLEAAQRKLDNGDFMESENHGGEDLSDDEEDDRRQYRSSSSTTTTALPTKPAGHTTKAPRKKLKKGSFEHPRSRKTDDDSLPHGNSLRDHEPAGLPLAALQVVEPQQLLNQSVEQSSSNSSSEQQDLTRRTRRHTQDDNVTTQHRRKQDLYDQLYKRRSKREHVYDRKYSHGGNAINFTETDESNSVSSFESGLFNCFNGAILLAEGFPPSAQCLNAHFLENGSHRMMSKHEITEDGYYYYIFYSDNDLVRNDIHAIFDIYKPTFQYSNNSDSQGCVNATNCSFPIGFLSDEIVVVEVPTRDGIEHEEDDITYLISTCHPRTEIYAIFPITVLLLILSCSFL